MLCKEFAAEQGIKIEDKLDSFPRSVDSDVALCIFRIVQEALRNVKKHSGAPRAQVILHLVDSTVHLSVCDQGVGFNRKELTKSTGLGIRSMEERARLLGGHFEIQSEPGKGTKVDASPAAATKITGIEGLVMGRKRTARRHSSSSSHEA